MRLSSGSLFTMAAFCLIQQIAVAAELPNIVLILADDLGYGDVGCYNGASKVPTPNLDRLASQGMRFTDAHSPSTVCTPTRYSIMTGRMAFRTGMRGVFTGAGGPCMIEQERLTLPQMLRNVGYRTAMFGKWHIGMTFFDKSGKPINRNGLEAVRRIDYSKSIPDAPIHRGFDQFYGTVCCPTTDWLYAYIDGDRIPVPPTKIVDRRPLPKHPYSKDNRPGMIAPNYNLEEVDLLFLEKSRQFLRQHAKSSPDQPFFLFHSAQAVHLPSLPADQFKGKTEAGPHGDFIFELDWIVGEIMRELKQLDLSENTIVMFASDNGPEVTSVVNMRADHQHDGARPWRGMKRDQWEGGHRTPLIIRWPAKVKAGQVSDHMVSLTDLFATCGSIVNAAIPNEAAEDSFDFSSVLLGSKATKPNRDFVLQQTISLALSVRQGDWKLLDHKGSGGNNYDNPVLRQYRIEDTQPRSAGQLYNLRSDPGETKNVFSQNLEIASQLKSMLDGFKTSGRSTPPRQTR